MEDTNEPFHGDTFEFFDMVEIKNALVRALYRVKRVKEENGKNHRLYCDGLIAVCELKKQHEIEMATAHAEIANLKIGLGKANELIEKRVKECRSLQQSNSILKGLRKKGK